MNLLGIAVVLGFAVSASVADTTGETMHHLRQSNNKGTKEKKLVTLNLEDGTLVEFFEAEDLGIISYTVSKRMKKVDDEDGSPMGREGTRGRDGGNGGMKGKWYDSPITMYEDLTGDTAPAVLVEADARRRQSSRIHDEDEPPPPEKGPPNRMLAQHADRGLASCPYQKWWERFECSISNYAYVDYCLCSSCWKGAGYANWVLSEDMLSTVFATKGDVTIVNSYWKNSKWNVFSTRFVANYYQAWTGTFGNNSQRYLKSTIHASESDQYQWYYEGRTAPSGYYTQAGGTCRNTRAMDGVYCGPTGDWC